MTGLLAILGQTGGQTRGLTLAGAVVMIFSILLVLGLSAFCMARILGEKRPKRHQRGES